MGYNKDLITHTLDLYKLGYFEGFNSVIELGAQVFDFISSYDTFVRVIRDYCGMSLIEDEEVLRFKYDQSLTPELLYRLIGFKEYCCVDYDIDFISSNGLFNAYLWDLNLPIPDEYKGRYDLLTNYGTCEHVFNIYQCFKNIHDLTHPSSVIIHIMPFQGYFDLTFFTFQNTFYQDLAYANDYKIMHMHVLSSDLEIISFDHWVKKEKNSVDSIHAQIMIVMNRMSDKPFAIPYQGMYKSGGDSLLKFKKEITRYFQSLKRDIGNRPVAFWGIDNAGEGHGIRRLINLLRFYEISFFIIDNTNEKRWGTNIDGIEIKGPFALTKDMIVLIPPNINKDELQCILNEKDQINCEVPSFIQLNERIFTLSKFINDPQFQKKI